MQDVETTVETQETESQEITETTPEVAEPITESEKPKTDVEYNQKVQERINTLTAEKYRYKDKWKQAEEKLKQIGSTGRPVPPNITDYTDQYGGINPKYNETVIKYEDDLDKWREDQRELKAEAEKIKQDEAEKYETFRKGAGDILEKHPDFWQVIDKEIFSPFLTDTIYGHDFGHELAYHLGKNEKEAIRLSNLPPEKMLVELGKIEERLTSLAKKSSSAPPPISPVDDGISATTKSDSELSDQEYFEREQKRELEKLKRKYG